MLIVLFVGVLIAVVTAWIAILFTVSYPRPLFDYVVGVLRWALRVWAYAKTLGWSYEDMAMANGSTYTIIRRGDDRVGGMMTMEGEMFEGMPEHWFAYIAVDDVDKQLELLKAEGGRVLREPFQAERVGRIAIVQDAGGDPNRTLSAISRHARISGGRGTSRSS